MDSNSKENNEYISDNKNQIAVRINNISKVYKLYKSNSDRLKESFSLIKKKKYHKDFYALNDVSFTVKKGDSLGILGRNGAGKSTLLKILTGVLTPTSGTYKVNGRISALIELGAGFNPLFTGVENIYFNGSILGYTKEEMDAKYEEIVNFADIGEHIYQPVRTYSSGMFIRLAFAVATSVDPEILIIDEALSVGDMFFQAKCAERMQKMIEGDTTLLFVSHNVGAIKSLCEKSILLERGRVIQYGKSEDVVEKYFQMKVQSEQKILIQKPENQLISDKDMELLQDQTKIKPLKNYSIDKVNNERFKDKEEIIVSKKTDEIIITGWAIDSEHKDSGENLFFEVDGQFFKADYGLERDDVAQAHGHYNYTFSGFRAYIPVKAFENGYNYMYIKLKGKDNDTIYSAEINKKVLIREEISADKQSELLAEGNKDFQKRAAYNRIQNGKAEFTNVQLLDEKGNEITLVEYEQKVTLRMTVKINEDIEILGYGYHIRNKEGVDVIYTDNAVENLPLEHVKNGENYIIDFKFNASLKEGQYNIVTVLSIPIELEIGKVDFCDFIPLAYQFVMNKRQDAKIYGLVHWHNKLEIIRKI